MLNELFMQAFGCKERLLEPLYGDEFYDDDNYNEDEDYIDKLEKVYDYLEDINELCQEDAGRYPTLEEWLMHIECEEFEDMFGTINDDAGFRSDVLEIIEELMYFNSVNTYKDIVKHNRKGE